MKASLVVRGAALTTLGLIASTMSATAASAERATVVPWDEVGPGWTFTNVTTGKTTKYGEQPRPQTATVSLVAPDGRRFALWSGGPGQALADQRGAQTLQLRRTRVTTIAITRNHRSGQVRHVNLRSNHVQGIAFGPGSSLLVVKSGIDNGRDLLAIRHADGSERVLARNVGAALPSANRRRVVVTDVRTPKDRILPWRVVRANGTLTRTLPMAHSCYPTRWTDADRVLASCWLPRYRTRLAEVNVKTGVLSWMLPARKVNYADTDLRKVAGQDFVFTARDCAPGFVSQRNPDGTLSPVSIPAVTEENEISLLDSSATELEFVMRLQCDGNTPRSSLFWFNPATNEVRTTYALPQNQVFQALVPVGRERPIGWR